MYMPISSRTVTPDILEPLLNGHRDIMQCKEGIAIGRTFALFKNYNIDGNKEMIAIGMMNIVGSCTSCYITTGAFSRSAVNYNAGCKTTVSNMVMATSVMIMLLFLTPLFYYTPIVVLSSIIVSAMLGLIDVHAFYNWLIEVHYRFGLMPETLYLTTNLLDRYLSIQLVSRSNYQLVGATAMLLASKYEEIWAPEISDFLDILENKFERKHVLVMEKVMLNKLKFHLTVPTPYVFLVRFLKAAGSDEEMENLVFFLMELSLMQYVTMKFPPSMLAAAAVYTAQCTLGKTPVWNGVLKCHTGYSEIDLKF